MFCPPDYVFIPDLVRALDDRAHEILADEAYQLTPDNEDFEGALHRWYCRIELATREFLSECPSLSVCSPQGVVLRIGDGVLSATQLKDNSLTYHHLSTSSGGWVVSPRKWSRNPREFGVIFTGGARDQLEEIFREREPDQGHNETERSLAKEAQKILKFEAEEWHRTLDQFAGWALVFHKDDFPKDVTALDQFIAPPIMDDDEENSAAHTSKVGRKEKVGPALAKYKVLFPVGHGSMTQEVVRQEISNSLGYSIGLRTLQRALSIITAQSDAPE